MSVQYFFSCAVTCCGICWRFIAFRFDVKNYIFFSLQNLPSFTTYLYFLWFGVC